MSTLGHNLTPEMIMLEWLKSVYETPTLSTSVKVIASAIYVRWNYEKNNCTITQQEIAELTSQNERTVRRNCNELTKFSLEFSEKSGRAATTYTYCPDIVPGQEGVCQDSMSGQGEVCPGTMSGQYARTENKGVAPTGDPSSAYRGPLQQLPQTPLAAGPNPILEPILYPILEPIQSNSSLRSELESSENDFSDDSVDDQKKLKIKPKKKNSRKRINYTASFEDFWQAYPTDANMSKLKAFEQWKKLASDDQQLAKQAVPIFVNYCHQNSSYRPVHAERFLAQRRFDGFLDESKQHYRPQPEKKYFNQGKKSKSEQILEARMRRGAL